MIRFAVLVFVLAFTGVVSAQQQVPTVAQSAPKKAVEVKEQPDFLKDLDQALKGGCEGFYKYVGLAERTLVSYCPEEESTLSTEAMTLAIIRRGGT